MKLSRIFEKLDEWENDLKDPRKPLLVDFLLGFILFGLWLLMLYFYAIFGEPQ